MKERQRNEKTVGMGNDAGTRILQVNLRVLLGNSSLRYLIPGLRY